MPTPCESWPRRLASTRLSATSAASSSLEPAATTMALTAAASGAEVTVRMSVMASSKGCEGGKRNKAPGFEAGRLRRAASGGTFDVSSPRRCRRGICHALDRPSRRCASRCRTAAGPGRGSDDGDHPAAHVRRPHPAHRPAERRREDRALLAPGRRGPGCGASPRPRRPGRGADRERARRAAHRDAAARCSTRTCSVAPLALERERGACSARAGYDDDRYGAEPGRLRARAACARDRTGTARASTVGPGATAVARGTARAPHARFTGPASPGSR